VVFGAFSAESGNDGMKVAPCPRRYCAVRLAVMLPTGITVEHANSGRHLRRDFFAATHGNFW
jgi:hypothetical protein